MAKETEQRTDTVVAILLAVAAVIAAVIGLRAGLLGDEGSDTFHTAVRENVKHGAAVIQDARFVYGEEAPLALRVAEARIRNTELRKAARGKRGELRRLLLAEAEGEKQLADVIGPSSEIAKDRRYATKSGGYDVPRRLADRRATNPDLVALDPTATEHRGADRTREAALLVAATIPVAIAFLLGALAEGFESRRRVFVPAGFAFAAIGLVMALVVELSL